MRTKTGGRKKGTANKTTSQNRDRIMQLFEDNWEQLKEDFSTLQPKDRLHYFTQLLKYVCAIPSDKDGEGDGTVGLSISEQIDLLLRQKTIKN